MEDYLLKYGLLMVAVILALTMAFFAFNALRQGEPTLSYEQEISGNSNLVMQKIYSLCTRCAIDSSKEKECFILKITLTDEQFQPTLINEEFPMEQDGNWQNPQAFKIENIKGTCKVTGLG
ncbi:MAG TPA: hypothetical protein VJB90_02140 [Candidatus Nanoarchaeia archaeon]|nr:hypothetical protein [Candidatus Nanoarchaeia archaeon]